MHDIDRNSILFKDLEKKKQKKHTHTDEEKQIHQHHDHHHNHKEHEHHHNHPHQNSNHIDQSYGHDSHTPPLHANHDHLHDERAYLNHHGDKHDHDHPPESRFSRDRVFTHLHGHRHTFYHAHHHKHDPVRNKLMHKIFKDPVRDWFAVGLMVLMIMSGYYQWFAGHLSDGILLCAAVLGIFPVFKNALLNSLGKRRPTLELFISMLLIVGLFMGRFLETALISLFLLIGSFMYLDFSWKAEKHA